MDHPPATWDELIGACGTAQHAGIGCYAGQYAKYEGLTVNASEAINTAGGSILGPDGVTPTMNTPEAKAGLQSLVDAYRSGAIPASPSRSKRNRHGRHSRAAICCSCATGRTRTA